MGMESRNSLITLVLAVIIAIVIGGLLGFVAGQRRPTLNSLPQIIPHIPNSVLVDLANTSAEVKNVQLNAETAGSIISIEGSTLVIAKGDKDGIRVTTNDKTSFVDTSQGGEQPIVMSNLKMGDNVLTLINVSGETITATKVSRQ